jgi:DNA-binding IscR family transcriptional regulator
VAREVWQDVATAVEGVLKGRTLEDLVRRQQAAGQGPISWDI